jgi:general secretion pathway protein G
MRTQVRKAFTLVEILIVVVILGILAAIVVPQFTNATQDAQAGNILTQLDTINNQIELFAARNNGLYPDFATEGWAQLMGEPRTGALGAGVGNLGGYLKSLPVNPACPGDTSVRSAIAIGAPAASAGWNWEETTPGSGVMVMKASFFDEDQNSPNYGKITPGVP